ncbi:MAG TPA: pirin family protein [Deferrisomatales bacterium]|nr:pirin family protein [Deferrisomatales bacterium]
MSTRRPELIFPSEPTLEGAGVHLRRGVGHDRRLIERFDPFLLLDDIHSTNPENYLAGFPWHPHRGIETVTYVLRGKVDHGDSLGNRGAIGSGDVQWMTAGSGIVHQEMPQRWDGDMRGLQLWVNLPASHKMMSPRYRDVAAATIPECPMAEGATVKVIAGRVNGCEGPVTDIVRGPTYLDVTVSPGGAFTHPTVPSHTVFAYVLEGSAGFAPGDPRRVAADHVVLLGAGAAVEVVPGGGGVRFLLFSGEPLGEPVAWRGPIVMNTEEELDRAFREYRDGTFIKEGRHP